MSSVEKRIACKYSILQCNGCKGYYRLPITITGGMLPVKLVCQICHHGETWNEIPVIGKRTALNAHDCQVIGCQQLLTEEYRPPPNDLEQKILAAELPSTTTYANLERTIRSRMAGTMSAIKELRHALASLAEQFIQDCKGDLETLHSIHQWDFSLCEFFFRFPFCSLHYPCVSELHSSYARYILAPRFFYTPYCYAVTLDCDHYPTGGMNLNVVNSYSLMSGLTPTMQEVLALPKPLQLMVVGNKLVGSDLAWLWKDIPGLIKDDDHTEENPSVAIHNNKLARTWLARRAINPWSANPIPPDVIKQRHVFETFHHDTESIKVWQQFVKHGRLALFCRCNSQVRSTAMCIAYLMQGIKGVFCTTQEQKEQWRKSYTTSFANIGVNNVIFCLATEETLDIQIEACQAIFVDASIVDEHILRILQRLMSYRGYVMVITEDPLMDFDEDDQVASLVHAVCGFTHQMKVVGDNANIRMPLRDNLKFKQMLKLLRNQQKPLTLAKGELIDEE